MDMRARRHHWKNGLMNLACVQDYQAKGYHYGPGPIEGHEFGLRLNWTKSALIAFLRTL